MSFRAGVFLSLLLVASVNAAGQQDSVHHVRKTLCLSLAGTSLAGVGLNYEQALFFKKQSHDAFAYGQGSISYPDFSDPCLLPQIGMGYCKPITSRKRLCVYGGISVGLMISLNPTPKHLRDQYDSLGFYGGRYVNPVEPWIIFDLGLQMSFKRLVVKAQFTPFLNYDRVYTHKAKFHPWAGISLGVKLN